MKHHHKIKHHHRVRKPHIEATSIETLPKIRFIEDLRNKHQGEEIWIIGSGPTIDDYPDNFFDNKIGIALKGAILAFPNSTYLMHCISSGCAFSRKKVVYGWLQDDRMHLLKRFIIPTHIIKVPPKFKNLPDWRNCIRMLRKRNPVKKGGEKHYFFETVEKIMKGEPTQYPCLDSHSHWGIQAAAILGAKKITLVGCDIKFLKWQHSGLRHGLDEFYATKAKNISPFSIERQRGKHPTQLGQQQGNEWLAEAFAPFGVEVCRYYYGKGYRDISELPDFKIEP